MGIHSPFEVELTAVSETGLHTALLKQVAVGLADDEMPVFDAGFKIAALYAAALPRFIVRLPKNFTAAIFVPV